MTSLQTQNTPVICGVEITTDAEGRFNLNALHKASGGDNAKRPSLWLANKQAKELTEELSRNSCLGQEVIKTVKGGTYPGTFAHELLAVEYAGWISPAFRLQVNQTFIDFRTGKQQSATDPVLALNDPEFLRGTLLTYTEKVIELQHQVDAMEPDVKAYKRIAVSDGGMCITEAAKALQVPPRKLFIWLQCNNWIYKRAGGKNWLGYQVKVKQQLLEHKVTLVARTDGSEKLVEQVLITPKGLNKLSSVLAGVTL